MLENFVKIDNKCYRLSNENRFRRHWQNQFKHRISKIGPCKKCGIVTKLTQHHIVPLRELPNKNVDWICRSCHNKEHMNEDQLAVDRDTYFIKICPNKHHTYLDFKTPRVYCKHCKYEQKLTEIKHREYKSDKIPQLTLIKRFQLNGNNN